MKMNDRARGKGEGGGVRFFIKVCLTLALCPLPLVPVVSSAISLPPFPPLDFQIPEPKSFTLSNGIRVLMLEDHDLPLVQVQLLFKAGTQYDPVDKVGLGSVAAGVWPQGGTSTRSPEDIERLIARTAAGIGMGVDLENGSARMTCRRQDLDEILAAWVDLLHHPLFRSDKLRLVKSQTLEGLRRMNDDPEDQARREFRRLIYGGAHPYARLPSPKSISNIKPADLRAWHQRYWNAEGLLIGVSGDFDPGVMQQKLEAAFGSMPRRPADIPAVAPVPPPHADGRVYFIRRPLKQTQIRLGGLGLARHDPDEFAWLVLNEIWGGSSSSRLFKVVRTQKGLAYSVGSAYSLPTDRGLIVAISQTQGAQTLSAIREIQDITRDLYTSVPSREELQHAQESLLNQFVQNFTTASGIVSLCLSHLYFGYPSDYLAAYRDRIRAVTASDLARVARRLLCPESLTIFLVGDPSTFEKPLSSLGKYSEVRPIDYSQDEP